MARVLYGAGIDKLIGSIDGWTFQDNRSGSIVRSKPIQGKNPTVKQTIEQAQFVSLIQQFQSLTPGEKLAWDSFAVINPKTDRFGQEKILTGQNWFTSVNSARIRMSLAILTVPPANLLPDQITSFNLDIDATKIEINSITPNNPADAGLLIFSSFPTTLSTKKQRGTLRETKRVTTPPYGTINLTVDWEAAHDLSWPPSGVASCINISVMLIPVKKSTGITGVGLEQIGGLDFVGSGIGSMEIESTFIVS